MMQSKNRPSFYLRKEKATHAGVRHLPSLNIFLFSLLFLLHLSMGTAFSKGVIMVVSQGWHTAEQAMPIEYTSVKPFGAVWNIIDSGGKARRINTGLIVADIWLPSFSDFKNIESPSDVRELENKLAEIESFKAQYPKSASKLAPTINLLKSMISQANKQVRINGIWMNRETHKAQIKEQKEQEVRAQKELAEKARLEEKTQKEREAKIVEYKAQEDESRKEEDATRADEGRNDHKTETVRQKEEAARAAAAKAHSDNDNPSTHPQFIPTPSLSFKGFSLNISQDQLESVLQERFGKNEKIESKDGEIELFGPKGHYKELFTIFSIKNSERAICRVEWQPGTDRKYIKAIRIIDPYSKSMFNAEDVPFEDFVQLFINAYHIPEIKINTAIPQEFVI